MSNDQALAQLKEDLSAAQDTVDNNGGVVKSKAQTKVVSLTKQIEALEQPKSKAKTLDEYDSGDRVVVKNVGPYLLQSEGVRFSPGIEMTTMMTGFIRDQVKAELFLLIDK